MAWIPMFNPNNFKAFEIPQFKAWLCSLKDENKDMSKVVYHYDVLGALHSFKITEKGLSCKDLCENYVYFRDNSKYKFYTNCLVYSDDSVKLELETKKATA